MYAPKLYTQSHADFDFWVLDNNLRFFVFFQGTLEIFSGLGMILGPSIGGGLYGVSFSYVLYKHILYIFCLHNSTVTLNFSYHMTKYRTVAVL